MVADIPGEDTSRLPELVQTLLRPSAYPEKTASVTLAQTQMSFVFIGDKFVYKVKKAVNLGYLDYTTLEKRLAFCEKELQLNRRLCPETYIGVIPITRENGQYSLGGSGEPVEYAVKMRYLPAERMLNVLLAQNTVTPAMITGVAEKMAEFHRLAETNETISAFGSLKIIKTNSDENFSQTESYIGKTITAERHRLIKKQTDTFIRANKTLFNKRVADGRVRDCHGDLHAAHICFTDSICIYDCIEFNDRFRYSDTASEIAFLAMDLDNYGRADLADTFVKAYVKASGDEELMALLGFYKCYRAYVRGKVEGFKLNDLHISAREKDHILDVAQKYFKLAEEYTAGWA